MIGYDISLSKTSVPERIHYISTKVLFEMSHWSHIPVQEEISREESSKLNVRKLDPKAD